MAETPVPITPGTGGASIASDLVGGNNYQQIKVVDATIGSNNAWQVNSDGSAQVSVVGTVPVNIVNSSYAFPINVAIDTLSQPPSSVSGTVTTVSQGSVAAVIIGGSIAASFTPPANQSVSGTVATNVQGSVATVIIGGSIAASFTPPANQSVSGTVGASIIGNVPAVIQGSVATVIIGGSIAASFTPPANQSVSGTVGASILGTVPVTGFPTTQNVSGSVVAFQGTTPWLIGSIYGNVSGSVFAVVQGLQGASVSGTVNITGTPSISGQVGASIIGVVPITGSVVSYIAQAFTGTGTDFNAQLSTPVGFSGGAVSNPLGSANYVYNSSIAGWDRWYGTSSIGGLVSTGRSSVIVIIQGSVATVGTTVNQSVSGTIGASIVGQLPAGTAMIGSVFAIVSGLQGASVSGAVTIAGNVTINPASVTAILGPYSASTQGITSVMTGTTSVLVLAAPGGTNRNYITHILVTNGAAVGTTVTIQDGASVLWGGYAAASGGGWSENFNPPLPQPTSVKALYATSSVQASVYVAVNGFTGT